MSEEVYVSKPAVSERISFIAAMTFSSSLVPSKEIVSSAAESTKCAGELSNVTPVTCSSVSIFSAAALARS